MNGKIEMLSANAHNYYHNVWLMVKQNKISNLDVESKILGKLMLEHTEYQHIWEKPNSNTNLTLEELIVKNDANPYLHLAVETTVLSQIQKRNPPAAARTYEALRTAGIEPHKARHLIGRVLVGVVWETSRKNLRVEDSYDSIYKQRLKRIARNARLYSKN